MCYEKGSETASVTSLARKHSLMVWFIHRTCSGRLCIINLGSFTLCSIYLDRCIAMSSLRTNLGRNSGNLGRTVSVSRLIPFGVIKEALTVGISMINPDGSVGSMICFHSLWFQRDVSNLPVCGLPGGRIKFKVLATARETVNIKQCSSRGVLVYWVE